MVRWCAVAIALAACGAGEPGASVDAADDVPGGIGEPAELSGMTLYHNQVRAGVDTTGLAAGPLPPLAWDSSLAATAAAWVARCQDGDSDGLVDHNVNRSVGHPWYVGENIYGSSGTATARGAVNSWAAEQTRYHYATDACDSGAVCGHYTQVVWRTTQRVGCALGDCAGLQYASTVVCDYGPGGNFSGQKPY
jgi:uncharacterized protein YkwD